MNNVFSQSQWIWCECEPQADSYAEFCEKITLNKRGKTVCRLSCDSDYALYVNGTFVASNQYADFEYYKIYDEIDITDYLNDGDNILAFEVWYFGVDSQKYVAAKAGLIYEIESNGQMIANSGKNTLSRKSRTYVCGRKKSVSFQLGFSFFYDSRKEDGWKNGELNGFSNSVIVEKNCDFFARPNKKLVLSERKTVASSKKWHSGLSFFVDLGAESVGLPEIEFTSPVEQKVTVTWCEWLSAGNVRRYMSANDYSFEFYAKAGKNSYFNPFLRIGCRYMQIDSETAIDVSYLGLKPFLYPLAEKRGGFEPKTQEDADIYRVCTDTLKLCAFEHYVDCPFREQGLYTFDSRNQMLAGYYAFDGFEYPKSNLMLLAMDRREDKLISITSPSKIALAIPAYSLYYVLQVWEYLLYSGEKHLEKAITDKVNDVMAAFSARFENGLLKTYKGKDYWNFYDWSDNLNGYGANKDRDGEADLMINCLYLIAYDAYVKICGRMGERQKIRFDAENAKEIVFRTFFDREDGLMSLYPNTKTYTQLANSLAVIADAAGGEAENICKKMIDGKTSECSLSMKTFFYDALLKTDGKYKEEVLSEIRKNYSYMLSCGATSAWETMESQTDGGSFCHGWSAMPVYYFNILKN